MAREASYSLDCDLLAKTGALLLTARPCENIVKVKRVDEKVTCADNDASKPVNNVVSLISDSNQGWPEALKTPSRGCYM